MAAWLLWLAAALALAVIETLTADLTFIMFAGGAVAGSVTAATGQPLWVQVLVFACVSTILLFVVRPWARRTMMRSTPEARTNTDALIGARARVLKVVDDRGGEVVIEGAHWSARLAQPGHAIEAEADVTVVAIDGAVALVAAVPDSQQADVDHPRP